MVCTRCGIIGADARPNWLEQRARDSLTAMVVANVGPTALILVKL
jgi:hypothetical protein